MNSDAGATAINVAPDTGLGEAARIISRALRAISDDHAVEARLLVCNSAGVDHARLIADQERALGAHAAALINARVARRLAREPLSRILGNRGFWSLTLGVAPAVLDPRPETETLVETALDLVRARRDEQLRILDLGVGSGAILCALLSELPNANGVGVDISPAACALARRNCEANGLANQARIIEGDFADAIEGRFDLVVSNPPYIASDVIDGLEPEVRLHDPRVALDGGPDGLACYRALARLLPSALAFNGFGVVEIGFDQAQSVSSLFREAGLHIVGLRKDIGERDRVLALRAADP